MLATTQALFAQAPPANFSTSVIGSGWNQPVGMAFSADGNIMFVWEKGGKVWTVIGGIKSASPLLDISQEVGNWNDFGLLGFAVDPNFNSSGGNIYLLYVVDRHYLLNFGTPAYNPAVNEYNNATIGRITRYSVQRSGNALSINPATRNILLGETKRTGIPILHQSHGVGSLVFGSDGTLMVSVGDGASYNGADVGIGTVGVDYYSSADSLAYTRTYAQQAVQDSIIPAQHNVGVFRAQMLSALNGKLLRLDPSTGNGVPSNPFYDAANPRSARSRIWAMGFRNPYRMTRRPDTGSPLPSTGNPGVFYLGDVGFAIWEELNIVNAPGLNFGWPLFEGLEPSGYSWRVNQNPDAPNSLYNGGSCPLPFLRFKDLVKQPVQNGTTVFGNPCNTNQPIPSQYTFVHARPSMDWKHDTGPARVGTFTGGVASVANVGAAGSPVSGPQFAGNASTGGVWYTGNDFPAQYKNTYFHADYGAGWIRNLQLNGSDDLFNVSNFIDGGLSPVCLTTNPIQGGLYYINYTGTGPEIRKIYYSGNRPPQAIAQADKTYGVGPLTVQFTGSNSSDPEGSITYAWNFGDGSPISTETNPVHVFTAVAGVSTPYTVTLTVTDNGGATSVSTLVISVNNTPPTVKITTPANNTLYSLTGSTIYNLTAQVTDNEQQPSGLSYQWQAILHHNNHEHPEPYDTNRVTTYDVAPIGCDGETYYFRILLTVMDAAGLSATDEVRLYPNCQSLAADVSSLLSTAGNAQVALNWTNPSSHPDEIMIVAKPNTGITANPSGDGSAYIADPNYSGIGSSFDGGKVVYKGAASSQTVTGLANNTPYFFKVFTRVSTYWSNGVEVTATPTCPVPSTQATNLSLSTITNNAMSVSWVNGNGSGRIVKISTSGIFNNPVNGSNPTANTVYQGSGEQVIFNGVSNSVNVSGLSPNTTYYFRVYEYNCSGIETSYDFNAANNNPNSGATNKIIPVLTWGNPADITTGTALSGLQLNATASVPGTFAYTPAAGTILNTGANQPLSVLFTPTDQVNYSTASTNVTINVVGKPVPVITWSDPADIIYGTALSGLQLNATASVAGTFAYTPAAGIVLNAGNNQTLSATFTPTDQVSYSTATKIVKLNVLAPPTCTASGTILREYWANVVGTSVSAIPVNTSPTSTSQMTSFQGPLPPAGQYGVGENYGTRYRGYLCVPTTGNYTFWIASDNDGELWLSTDANPANRQRIAYIQDGFVYVNQWTKYPTQQSAAVNLVAGRSYYIEALHKEATGGDQLQVGWRLPTSAPNAVPVVIPGSVLSPFATSNISPTVSITSPVNNAVYALGSNISINANATDSDGTIAKVEFFNGAVKLGESTISPYSFTMANASAGSYTLIARATDNIGALTNSSPINITVTSATPVLTWSPPSNIIYGTALSGLQLNATASVAGTFAYTPAAGTVLSAGTNQTLSVTFTPTDQVNYTTATTSVSISVAKATPIISWNNPSNISSGTALSGLQLNATASVAGTFAYTPAAGTVLSAGNNQALATTFTPSDLVNYTTATSSVHINVVSQAISAITWSDPADITSGTALSGLQLNATASVAGTFVYTPAAGTILSAGNNQTLSVTFTPTDQVSYSTATKIVKLNVLAPPTCTASGTILREYWANIKGSAVSAIPVNTSPTSTSQMTSFQGPLPAAGEYGVGENYGTRYRGYLCVPTTGNYTFWIASDNDGELWLSTDNNPNNKVKIAYILDGYVYSQWTKYSTQQSAAVNLVAGRSYYIEALHKEATGGDQLLVGWRLPTSAPNANPVIIPGSVLSPFVPATARVNLHAEEAVKLDNTLAVYPNPFSSKTAIEFSLEKEQKANLQLFDLRGIKLESLYEGNVEAGKVNKVELDGQELTEGIYILRLTTPTGVIHKKIILSRD